MNREEIEKLAEVQYPESLTPTNVEAYEDTEITKIRRECYVDGYTQALPKWVDVNERLPE